MSLVRRHRVLPFGAEPDGDAVRFRLWAPAARSVELAIEEGPSLPMEAEPDGWFSLTTEAARPGTWYRYRIGETLYPDPASRSQPEDVAGPSEVVDPAQHAWTDEDWQGIPWSEIVLYELHTGTFSESGDFAGVARHLDHLVGLGVNAIEIMPVAEFPGRWNWGYDGVLPYAVEAGYGGPEGLKQLVEACHARGIAVILDVVYNHFGPEGNYLHAYAPRFFTERHRTPWGAGINFDDEGSRNVREFFVQNALYWLEEYHVDGLRFDAVHAILDDSKPDIVVELGRRIREAISGRPVHLILENDRNRASVLAAEAGGPGPHTAQWNDDFHHALRVLITGKTGGYYDDYAGEPARLLGRILAEGFAYQGEASAHRKGKPRGEPSAGLPPTAFVSFIQNHDQVGNHAYGWRLGRFAGPEQLRAAAAVLLLSPQIPMLWQGEEWNSDRPFPFFCDFAGELADAVRKGRLEEFSSFPEFRDDAARAKIPDPLAEETFRSAVLDWSESSRPGHAEFADLYRTLIEVRQREIVPLLGDVGGHSGSFTVFGPATLAVSWTLAGGKALRMVLHLAPEPADLLVPPPPGRQLFATAERRGDRAPAWYVSVSLQQ